VNSQRARLFNAAIRLAVRRRRWGDERELTRRARRIFGAPMLWQWLSTRDTRIVRSDLGGIGGEWLEPPGPLSGTLLYLHGGGFVCCSPATHRPITAGLARRCQCRVFAVDYRRAPEHRFPAALDDCVAAYVGLLDRGIPAQSIALAGDSAGGGLVLSTLVRLRNLGRPLPACAVCFSPWTDLAGTGASVTANDGRCAMFHTENIGEFARVYLGGKPPEDPEASPVNADLRALPPLLLQVGSAELLLDDARRIDARARAAGGVSQLHVYDDLSHGWQMMDRLVPEADEALAEAAQFICSHVKPV
jgi:acetyl esterase/lipase